MDTNKDYIPRLLNAEERDNPYLLLEEFFTTYPLPELREMIRKYSRVILSSKQIRGLEFVDVLLFYEELEKLFEATHMLKMRYDSLIAVKRAFNETKPTSFGF